MSPGDYMCMWTIQCEESDRHPNWATYHLIKTHQIMDQDLFQLTKKRVPDFLFKFTESTLQDSLLSLGWSWGGCGSPPFAFFGYSNFITILFKRSHLKKLSPYLDNAGHLRVAGWLSHSDLESEERNLLIMFRQHQVTNLLKRQDHGKVNTRGITSQRMFWGQQGPGSLLGNNE